jgi:CobQ-like glutamine amidotransferase family enzyme
VIRVLRVLPDELNVHGDAENALVLAQRARWSGVEAEIVDLHAGEPAPSFRPDAVVVGSGTDPRLAEVATLLAPFADRLRGWVSDGVPLVAVGTGFELLTEGIGMGVGAHIPGLAIFAGTTVPAPGRATGDLVVRSASGTLVGFEHHARHVRLADAASALGTVTAGVGNGGGAEGAVAGSAIGTHLHGPVLAKNPALADSLLTGILGTAYDATNPEARFADELAAAVRVRTTAALGVRTS